MKNKILICMSALLMGLCLNACGNNEAAVVNENIANVEGQADNMEQADTKENAKEPKQLPEADTVLVKCTHYNGQDAVTGYDLYYYDDNKEQTLKELYSADGILSAGL